MSFMRFCMLACILCSSVLLGGTWAQSVEARQRPLRTVAAKSGEQPYVQVFVAEVLRHPNDFQGRRVTLTAEIVSVNARQESLDIYDQHSRAQIGVSLAELSRLQRRRLVADPIRRVTVFGRVEVLNGRPHVKAEQVAPVEMVSVER